MEKGKTGSVKMPNNFDTDSMDAMVSKLMRIETQSAVDYASRNYKQKLYFAGPWFDNRALLLYEACQRIAKEVEPDGRYSIYYPKDEVNKTPMDAFNKNVAKIADCDALIALVSRKDVGTAWEIGMAYALGKPVYLLGYDYTTFLSHTNVMLAFTGSCFTISKFAKFLVKGLDSDDYVQISNEWEGIE